MAKASRVLTSLLLGAAGGAAAAVFLASKSGQTLKKKVNELAKDYQTNPEEVRAEVLAKAEALGKQATEKWTEVKERLAEQQLAPDDFLSTLKAKVQTGRSDQPVAEEPSEVIEIDFLEQEEWNLD